MNYHEDKKPSFRSDRYQFTVVMPNLNYGTHDLDNGIQDGTRNGTQKQIIELMLHNPKITRKEIASQLNVSVRTLQRILNEMSNVHYIGRGMNGHWTVDE